MSHPDHLPPVEACRAYLSYDPEMGTIISRATGKDACRVCVKNDYLYLNIGKNTYRSARMAWYLYFGRWPDELQVHHIDSDKTNNRIENLILVTDVEHRLIHANGGRLDVLAGASLELEFAA